MNAPPPLPSRPLKAYAAVAKGALWLLLALWLVLALAWGALHAWIVPRIGEFRPVLESQAGRALGVPVRIGSVSARSEGLIPSFELREVVLLDAQGREALRLPRVLAALSPRSLWNLGFEQLYIEGPRLDIRRAADGRISVAGLDFSRSSDNDGRAADWFFRQGEFAIRGGMVRWTDEMRGAPPLALDGVDFVMRNRARRHALRLDATPPAEWGARFSLAGQFRQPLLSGADGQWREWIGELYADFARVDLSQLRRYADLGVRIGQGQGSVRAWADVDRGRLVGGTADVALYEAEATLGANLQPLAFRQLSGRLGGKRLAEGFSFQTQELQFETRDGLRWPGGNVSLSWTEAHGQKPAAGELKADKLDLAALGQIATRLPLGTATHAALTAYAPQGLVETLQAKWQGPLGALQSYEARGKASRLALAAQSGAPVSGAQHAQAGIPGLRGASVDFDFTQKGGKARLAVQQGALEFPGVFDDPVLPMDSLSGELQWQIDGPKIAVSVANLKFSNRDAEGQVQASWRTSDAKAPGRSRFPGVLELQGSLSRADGTRVWRYLPLGVPASAREYVHESVQRGVATAAKFRVKGDLHDFPFKDGKSGEFLVTADIKDATYAYVPRGAQRGTAAWPALTQLSGELVFQGNGMQVKGAVGRFAGAPGLQVKAEASIPDFHTTTVGVTGLIRGPLAESLAIVNGSPVAGFTGNALAKARAGGAADVQLRLLLPVHNIDRSQVQGTVTLPGNDLQITPDSPMLARAKGAVTFSERSFALAGTQARALGGDVRIEGGMRPAPQPGADPVIQIRASGTATAEGLRQARELGFVARLARDFSGGASYAMTLNFKHGTPELSVASNLQGLGVNLPAPLRKAPETALPLRYDTVVSRDAAGRVQDQLTVELGRLASVVFQRDVSAEEARVLRGSIAIGLAPGETAPLPEQGVTANVQLAQLNIDAWEAVLDRVGADASRAGTAAGGRGNGTSAVSSMGYLPTSMAARARELVVEGRTLHDVVIGGSRDGLTWRSNVDAQELNGYVEYRQPSGAEQGRVYARLARLGIAASAAREVETLLDQQPANIPALDVVVNEFELKGKKLGRLEIDAVNRGARDGAAREWRLNKLALTTPEAVFNAQGNWAAVSAQAPAAARGGAEQHRTAMRFQLDIADAGGLLARFGMPGVVRRGHGRMEGQIAWLGSPLSMDYPSMTGGFRVNVEGGQFLKADPGLAKLLGVLSLQSLPRRLALDFRDVFSEGFPFDFVRGDIAIDKGIASTNNLQMKGVNAAVLMEGKADIARETQDLKVVVVPEINAGTASLVATMINPAIGLGSFLAQMFLRQPLMRAATQEFHIDGTWSDPKVARVGRGAAAAAGAPPVVPAENR